MYACMRACVNPNICVVIIGISVTRVLAVIPVSFPCLVSIYIVLVSIFGILAV